MKLIDGRRFSCGVKYQVPHTLKNQTAPNMQSHSARQMNELVEVQQAVDQLQVMDILREQTQELTKTHDFYRQLIVESKATASTAQEDFKTMTQDLIRLKEENFKLQAKLANIQVDFEKMEETYKDGIRWIDILVRHPKTRLNLNRFITMMEEKEGDSYQVCFTSKNPSDRVQRPRRKRDEEDEVERDVPVSRQQPMAKHRKTGQPMASRAARA